MLTLLLASAALHAQDVQSGPERVPRTAITAAMREEQGYERRVTANQSRLQTRVLLRLARAAHESHPEGAVLFIDHEDWFHAYLEALDLREDEAPLSVRLTHENEFDIFVDGRTGAVVDQIVGGAARPAQALNVKWRSRRGTHYSYRDPYSRPVLEMSFERTVSYRLLEFDGMVVQDEFKGASGRPATGPLSLLFRLIGQARADWSRSAVSSDGWQVIVGRARKGPFSRTGTVTVQPDGSAETGVPPDRPDLADLQRRLRQPLGVVYRRWTRD